MQIGSKWKSLFTYFTALWRHRWLDHEAAGLRYHRVCMCLLCNYNVGHVSYMHWNDFFPSIFSIGSARRWLRLYAADIDCVRFVAWRTSPHTLASDRFGRQSAAGRVLMNRRTYELTWFWWFGFFSVGFYSGKFGEDNQWTSNLESSASHRSMLFFIPSLFVFLWLPSPIFGLLLFIFVRRCQRIRWFVYFYMYASSRIRGNNM